MYICYRKDTHNAFAFAEAAAAPAQLLPVSFGSCLLKSKKKKGESVGSIDPGRSWKGYKRVGKEEKKKKSFDMCVYIRSSNRADGV